MTPEEMRAGIARLGPWFHCIQLAPDIVTKTASLAGEPADHPNSTWEIVRNSLPADLSGKRVLDVGCNAGFYSVEAKRRNATYVLGVDAQRREIRQASFVRRALGLDVDFRRMSVYDLSPSAVGTFDITLALGLVYHLKHLVLGLERLFSVTSGLLILETEVLPPDEAGMFQRVLGGLDRRLHALAYVENPQDAMEPVYNWFIPTVDCLVSMLQNIGFVDVNVAAVTGGRAVVTCRRPDFSGQYAISHLGAALDLDSGPVQARVGQPMTFVVRARNTGFVTWDSAGEAGTGRGAVRLGAHLLRDDEEVAWDYGRGDISAAVTPGQQVLVSIQLTAPSEPGSYRIEFDLVAEHLTWFEDCGSAVLSHAVEVLPS